LNKLHIISGLIGLVGLLAGCGEAPPPIVRGEYPLPQDVEISEAPVGEYGGIFIVAETTQPTTFNGYVPNNLATSSMLGRMFNALIDYHPMKAEIVPSLAKRWSVEEDNKTYTFHLREGIQWSDGEAFTADDVMFTFDVILADRIDPDTGEATAVYPTRYYASFNLEGGKLQVKKIDDYTVQFYTPSVYAPFLFDLMSIIIYPEHKLGKAHAEEKFMEAWTTQTGIDEPEEIVGTGPFMLETYRPGERLIMKPNPHYWRADSEGNRLPYIDRLIWKFVTESNTEVISFATGQTSISGIGSTDVEWVRRYAEMYDFTIYDRGPSTSVSMLWFNQNPDKNEDGEPHVPPHKLKWFQNKLFRQAMFYCFDREAAIDAIFFGRGKPIDSLISEAKRPWFNEDIKQYRYDPAKARELLEQAGFTWDSDGACIDPQGNPVEFTILLPSGGSTWEDLIVVFKENVAELGVTVNINPIDFATLIRKMDYTFDYEAAVIGWGSNSAAYDPSGSKAMFLSEGVYHLWYPKQKKPATDWEARIDELFRQQEQILNMDERVKLMHEVQAILAEQAPMLYLIAPEGYAGVKNRWKNIIIPPAGSITWNIDEIWTPEPQAE